MSCYLVEEKHVAYLVATSVSMRLALGDGGSIRWFTNGDWMNSKELRCTATNDELAEVATMLWRENVKSVNDRYNDSDEDPEAYTVNPDLFNTPLSIVDPVQVLKSCACFEYQACESEGWKESEACAFIEVLRKKCIDSLESFDDAQWGAPAKW